MIGRTYNGRRGDHILLRAKVRQVMTKPGDPDERLAVDIDGHGGAPIVIRTEAVHKVLSESIRVGDLVRVEKDECGIVFNTGEPWLYAEVLHIESAESVTCRKDAEPGDAMALLKPRGLTPRPRVAVKYLQRAGVDKRDAEEDDVDPMPDEGEQEVHSDGE